MQHFDRKINFGTLPRTSTPFNRRIPMMNFNANYDRAAWRTFLDKFCRMILRSGKLTDWHTNYTV